MSTALWIPYLAITSLCGAPAPAPAARPAAPAARPAAEKPAATAAAAEEKPAPPAKTEDCMACHNDKSLTRPGPGGSKQSVFVDLNAFKASTHKDLTCDNCHAGITTENHTSGEKRGSALQVRKACLGCHEPDKGLHGQLVQSKASPSCGACHGSHSIQKKAQQAKGCLGCHGQHWERRLPGGERISFQVDARHLSASVHKKLGCQACHPGYTQKAHPKVPGSSRKERAVTLTQACNRCHAKVTRLTTESVHAHLKGAKAGRAPGCTDCHGAHDVADGRKDRFLSASRCKTCHVKVYAEYKDSVHGAALVKEHNRDVPTCADCHRAHDVRNPGSDDYRARIPKMCGNCHSDRARMRRYSLSPEVVNSYLDDFHGVTLQMYAREKRSVRRIATCVDCHGIHDIRSTKGSQGKAIKSRLLTRCRKCHPNASAAFPDAWVSHWIPSAKRAPLVWAIQWFYKILIPLMLLGLGLQVLLHFWRYAVKR